jgi:uncharacterized protein
MKNYKFVSKTIYFPKEKILVIGDLHFGYEEELNERGIAIPRRQIKEIIQDFEKILKKVKKIEKIIILGDIRHSFGKILLQEKEDLKKFFEFLIKKVGEKEIIITKGNHDTMIKILLEKENWKNVKLCDYFLEKNKLFFHGDHKSLKKVEKLFKKCNLIVVGHFHPAIDISDGEKVERFKCFLVGNLNKKEIIFVPSFFPLIEGVNILRDGELDYYDIKNKEVFVISPDGKVLDFGNINKTPRPGIEPGSL